MLARLQQFITLGLLTTAAAWAAVFLARGEAAWAVLGALFILLGYALVLALEFILLCWVNRSDPTPNATPLQLFNAWFGEVITAPMVFCWRQPFASNAVPDFLPASVLPVSLLPASSGKASTQRGVVLDRKSVV